MRAQPFASHDVDPMKTQLNLHCHFQSRCHATGRSNLQQRSTFGLTVIARCHLLAGGAVAVAAASASSTYVAAMVPTGHRGLVVGTVRGPQLPLLQYYVVALQSESASPAGQSLTAPTRCSAGRCLAWLVAMPWIVSTRSATVTLWPAAPVCAFAYSGVGPPAAGSVAHREAGCADASWSDSRRCS